MSSTDHEHWPWRNVTTWMDEIEGMIKFKLLYRDREGNPMVDRLWFTANYGADRLRDALADRTAEREAEGASFPEDAAWV